MPKGLNLKNFGRRKSSGNALEGFELPADRNSAAPPEQSSFRVLERQDKKSISYNNEKVASRPFNSPLHALRGKSVDDLARGPKGSVSNSTRTYSAWPLNGARGSGGTTNSGSSGFYESSGASARHSSTSTLPSSLDQDKSPEDEELFPVRKTHTTTGMYRTVAANADEPPPPPPPSFSSRAARAFSFGNKHNRGMSRDKDVPPMPPPHAHPAPILPPPPPMQPTRSHSPFRERAMTTSSYASTAVPTKTELRLDDPDFGTDDFGNMFESLKKEPMREPSPIGTFHRTDSEPMYPPRTHSRNALTPSPNPQHLSRNNSNSPYSFDDESSNDSLIHSPALSSPSFPDGGPSGPVGNGITQAFLGNSKSGYSRVPERYTSPGPERDSQESLSGLMTSTYKEKEPAYPNRQAQVDDEDRWVRKVELRDGSLPQLSTSPNRLAASSTGKQPIGGPARGGAISPSSAGDSALESNTTTPRAARKLNVFSEDSMFDASPNGPVSRAIRPGAGHQRTESGTIKKMTKAQFNALKRQGESSAEQSEEEEQSGDDYDDDDDIERARKMASQRQKQEANMSVYRQQMKKVTGGGPTDLPSSAASTVRPPMDQRSSSTSVNGGAGLHFGGIGGAPPEVAPRGKEDDDDDDDVPLGILQAHGFPSGSRPPTRQGENDLLHQRRTSASGSAVLGGGAGQGNLPPFARRLPADPYFGAGLVNQSTRESLALNNSSASVIGVPPSAPPHMMQQQQMSQQMPQTPPVMGHPGGLVGVIAGEERARAARRGSPNPTALMGQGIPLPSNMMPPAMPRTMSMGNLPPPSVYNPSGFPPMPQMPQMGMPGMMPMQMPQGQDPGNQQMQQFMQMQMQVMQNMLTMQQMQMGQPGTPSPQIQPPQQQQQTGDYLGVNFNNQNRPMSMASHTSNQFGPPPSLANQGRSMTMLNPPSGWGSAANPSGPRPNSAMPLTNGYAPSVQGLNISNGATPNGYAPSIAPSERSNIGMPSRYRPVTQNGDTSRAQSMTSTLTLQPFQKQQTSPNLPGTPFNAKEVQVPKQTIRIVDKPKGAPRAATRAVDEDEDDGWADMKKNREQKKKSKWSFRKDKTASGNTNEPALSELYTNMD